MVSRDRGRGAFRRGSRLLTPFSGVRGWGLGYRKKESAGYMGNSLAVLSRGAFEEGERRRRRRSRRRLTVIIGGLTLFRVVTAGPLAEPLSTASAARVPAGGSVA